VVYLVIMIVVAAAGITRLWLQQRKATKAHELDDFRSSLEKLSSQPLAQPTKGLRERWQERRAERRLVGGRAARVRARLATIRPRRSSRERVPRRSVRWSRLGLRKPRDPWFIAPPPHVVRARRAAAMRRMRARHEAELQWQVAVESERPSHSAPSDAGLWTSGQTAAFNPATYRHQNGRSFTDRPGRSPAELDPQRRAAARLRIESRRRAG
jgi:hypothetical protein